MVHVPAVWLCHPCQGAHVAAGALGGGVVSLAGGVASGKVRVADQDVAGVGVALAERRLWRAVFEDAVGVLQQRRAVQYRDPVRKHTEAWFESVEVHVGSFEWLCQLFNLDSTAVREQLQRTAIL